MAKTLVKKAKATSWAPMITAMQATARVPVLNSTLPTWTGASASDGPGGASQYSQQQPRQRNNQSGE